ncbi:MAG: oligosaccharide flippase family protein [Gaiellaceae bacterium]
MSEIRAEEGLQAEAREDEEVPRRLGIGALAHDAAIYGGVRVLLKSLAFLLVPLYARHLSPAEFGTLELILAFAAFVDVFINLSGVLARFYFDQDDSRWRKQAITLFFLIESIYPAVLIGGLLLFASRLADPVAGEAAYASLIVIALVDLYLTNIVDISMSLTRMRRKPWTFALYALIRGLTYVTLAVLLVAVWELGVKGILIASLTSAIIVFVVSAREYVRDLIRGVDWDVGKEMIAFGWPTIVSAFSFYALNLLDRFFVKHYHGAAETGLYGVAFRYSQIVLVGVFAFRMGWPQWHYSWLNSDRHPQMVARGASWFFGALGFLVVLVSAWILPLFHLLMPERYWEATEAVPPLSIAAMATGAYAVTAVGLNVTKRMRLIIPTVLAAAVVAVGLYFLLIPPYGFVGAAWATAGGLWSASIFVGIVSHRIYPVPWEWRRVGLAVGVTLALALASLAVDARVPFDASLPVRVAITLAYPAALLLGGFLTAAERRRLTGRLRRR